MKSQRSSLGTVIGLTVGITAVYLISVVFQCPAAVAFGLSALAIAATAWMAIRILKDPYSTDKTFDDQFYHDRDDIRRHGTE